MIWTDAVHQRSTLDRSWTRRAAPAMITDYADETPASDPLAYRRLAHFSSRVTAGKKIHTLSGRRRLCDRAFKQNSLGNFHKKINSQIYLDCLFLCGSSTAKMWTVPWSLETQINDESLLKLILQHTTPKILITECTKQTQAVTSHHSHVNLWISFLL